jgi:ketosteroid isomerase-like protein
MSQENVAVARRLLGAFNRGDRAAWLALLDDDYEVVPVAEWPDPSAVRGGEAGWDFYVEIAHTLSFGHAYIDFVDAGGDKVLGHQRHEAHGRTSGANVEIHYWIVMTCRNGKVLRDEWYTDRAEAFEAAGLSAREGQNPERRA